MALNLEQSSCLYVFECWDCGWELPHPALLFFKLVEAVCWSGIFVVCFSHCWGSNPGIVLTCVLQLTSEESMFTDRVHSSNYRSPLCAFLSSAEFHLIYDLCMGTIDSSVLSEVFTDPWIMLSLPWLIDKAPFPPMNNLPGDSRKEPPHDTSVVFLFSIFNNYTFLPKRWFRKKSQDFSEQWIIQQTWFLRNVLVRC